MLLIRPRTLIPSSIGLNLVHRLFFYWYMKVSKLKQTPACIPLIHIWYFFSASAKIYFKIMHIVLNLPPPPQCNYFWPILGVYVVQLYTLITYLLKRNENTTQNKKDNDIPNNGYVSFYCPSPDLIRQTLILFPWLEESDSSSSTIIPVPGVVQFTIF